jgi:hypothetical protein
MKLGIWLLGENAIQKTNIHEGGERGAELWEKV